MVEVLAHFPVDPAYGTGVYRRRLRFVAASAGVTAQVDDTHHSYWVTLDHDGQHVTAIAAGFNRAPTDMCPGSTAALQALVGLPLRATTTELMARLPRTSNCTHLSDLALWSTAHIAGSATWDVEVPDEGHSPVWIEVRRDGQVIHRWRTADFEVVAPGELAGKPLMGGFRQWAGQAFADDELLAATMLQRGLFVARGRRHIVDLGPPTPLASAAGMAGMCWAYSGERLERGSGTLGYVRDFTAGVVAGTSPPHVVERFSRSSDR